MEVDSSAAATALLTEHLQYTPLSLIDDIIDSVNNYIYQGINSLEAGLLSTPPERLGFKPSTNNASDNNGPESIEYPEAKQEIEEGLHKLETLLNSTVDKNFDKFEIFVLRNILAVPPDLTQHIRLGHYEGISYPLPQHVPTMDDIDLLRRRLTASRAVSRQLHREHERNEAIIAQLRELVAATARERSEPNLAFLANKGSTGLASQQGLTTNTKFALSQLPGLQKTLMDLKTKLQVLRTAQASLPTAKDEIREERRGYIEQRKEAFLDRNGRINDADTFSGRLVDPSELDAMGKVAKTFNPP